jgi:hypothetical protein
MLGQKVIKQVEVRLNEIRSLAAQLDNEYLSYFVDMAVSEARSLSSDTVPSEGYQETESNRTPSAAALPCPSALRLVR